MSTRIQDTPILDISSADARRRTFRKLLAGFVVLFAGAFAVGVFGQLPETIQMAIDLENDSVPSWKVYAEALCEAVLLGVLAWAIYQLWHFQSAGLLTFAAVTFAPYFLVQGTPSPGVPLADYLGGMESVLAGMILLMGWVFPDILAAPDGSVAGDTPTGPG